MKGTHNDIETRKQKGRSGGANFKGSQNQNKYASLYRVDLGEKGIKNKGKKEEAAVLGQPSPSGTKDLGRNNVAQEWAKKRPRRDDGNLKKFQTQSVKSKVATNVVNLKGSNDNNSSAKVVTLDLGDNIKTTMEVLKISPNHLVFKDHDEGQKDKHLVSGGQPHATGVGSLIQTVKETEMLRDNSMECETTHNNGDGGSNGTQNLETSTSLNAHTIMHK